MTDKSLQDLLESADNAVQMLRENGATYTSSFPVVENEYTNWIEEQRAIMESVALGDLSHHMVAVHVEGPEAMDLFSDLCVNDFSDFTVGEAKQMVCCSPDGYIMGDGPLLRLGEEEFWGVPTCGNWIVYNTEVGGYDAEVEIDPLTPMQEGMPETFIFQVQGPDAYATLDKLTDANLADIPFYSFEEVEVAGHAVRAFGHGMNTEPGLELHGPYEIADEVRNAIMDAGEEFGIRRIGSKAYVTQSVRLGWIAPGPQPVFTGEEMRDYREWLPADSYTATYSIEGSYQSDDVSDYYMTPVELGYEKLIDFDHDFVGKEPLKEEVANPDRQFVSLIWDDDDVVDVYGSLFKEGLPNKYMELPRFGWARAAFDEVRKDGELIGTSQPRSYQWDIRSIASLARLDVEHAEPGTEVTVIWGEGPNSPNPHIEEHEQTEISATVHPVPYTEDRRKM